jgi:hypothetical protein
MHYTNAVIGRAGGDCMAQAMQTKNPTGHDCHNLRTTNQPLITYCVFAFETVDPSLIKRCEERGNETYIQD